MAPRPGAAVERIVNKEGPLVAHRESPESVDVRHSARLDISGQILDSEGASHTVGTLGRRVCHMGDRMRRSRLLKEARQNQELIYVRST